MPRTVWIALAAAALLSLGGGGIAARAQSPDKPVGNLRLAKDASGAALPLDPSAQPPEKVYRLPGNIDQMTVAFDFQGTEPTDVSVRVIGPAGTIEFQEQKVYDKPGTHVIIFKKGSGPIADNEYVVNAYVGEEQYLADSLQVAVGEAEIPGPRDTEAAPQATSAGPIPTVGGGEAGANPPNPFTPTLILAGLGLVALAGVVLWAVRSAMGASS